MTKAVKRKPKKKQIKEDVNAVSTSITQLYYEMDSIRMMMNPMKDEELFDFCVPHIEMFKHYDLDKLYPKLIDGKPLNVKERKALEGFCILVNTELTLVV